MSSSRFKTCIEFPHEWSFTELADGLREHNHAAGRAFVKRFSQRVNQLVWRLMGACSEHDDLVQQVFTNAFDGIEKLRDPERLEAWLVSLTVNTVRKEIRSRRLRRFFVIFGHDEDTEGGDLDPEHQAAAHELYRILGQIHPEERLVFVLCMVEGMTQKEAACACGISLSTCKRRLARAMERASELVHGSGKIGEILARKDPS